jgi:carboxymethylenebutenolidase
MRRATKLEGDMRQATIEVTTVDGAMDTRIFDPDNGRRHAVVIVFMDGLGIRPALDDMARRIASNGYFVALPNLFHRSGAFAPFDPASVFGDPAERQRIMSLIKEVTPARVLADAGTLIERLRSEPSADAARIGTVGYCMGGGPAISVAGAYPDRVLAAASYHGGHLATDAPDSPHVLAAKARGRLYVGCAENDSSFPDSERLKLEAALREAGVPHTIEQYHAAHGFTMTDFPVYDRAAADRHWDTLLALFRESLA